MEISGEIVFFENKVHEPYFPKTLMLKTLTLELKKTLAGSGGGHQRHRQCFVDFRGKKNVFCNKDTLFFYDILSYVFDFKEDPLGRSKKKMLKSSLSTAKALITNKTDWEPFPQVYWPNDTPNEQILIQESAILSVLSKRM